MTDTVVTIVSGRHDHLREQRRGLARSHRKIDRHVVVAMGDPDIDDVVVDGLGLPTTVVHVAVPPAGLPLATARNAGARAAGDTGLLIFLDVDCIPDERLVERYVAAAAERPDAVLCGPVTYLPPSVDAEWTPARLTEARAPHPARPDPPTGALVPADPTLFWSLSFAVRVEVWERIGGFYEGYIGYGGEDTDFARVAVDAGVPILWAGGADAYHQHHGSDLGPAAHVDDIVRNGSVYAARHGEWPMIGWLRAMQLGGIVRPTPAGWQRTDAVRVASVPDRHDYVRAVLPTTVQHALGGRSQGWAPDPIWDVDWLAARVDELDVVHVHFGYERVGPEQLERWLALLAAHGVALIVTVHDLRNPHDETPGRHEQQQARLVAAAAHVFTLTDAAADECERRFGRRPEVVVHPTPMTHARPPTPAARRSGVLVPLKALRANVVDPLAVVRAVVAGAGEAPVRVLLHPIDHRAGDVAALHRAAHTDGFEIDVRPYLSVVEVEDLVASAVALVVPYRFGTHSGWVELGHDLGTRVVAPDCGYFADQWDEVVSYRSNETDGLDPASLTAAVADALRKGAPAPADPTARAASRDVVRAMHDLRYREIGAR